MLASIRPSYHISYHVHYHYHYYDGGGGWYYPVHLSGLDWLWFLPVGLIAFFVAAVFIRAWLDW